MNQIINALVVVMLAAGLAACSGKGGGKQVQGPLEPVSCVVVIPAMTSVDRQEKIDYASARELEKGARFTTAVLRRELADNPKVRFVDETQVAKLVPEVSGGVTGTVAAIGKRINCEAVLLTQVKRYRDRVGTEYAAESPASASVRMVLRHTEKGSVLWSADFRETQESFFENILSYDKMKNRGFKWIGVEQLVEQGVAEKLASCPYLK